MPFLNADLQSINEHISNHRPDEAAARIAILIKEGKKNILQQLDENNKSLLMHAMMKEMHGVAYILYKKTVDRETLFKPCAFNRTLLGYAMMSAQSPPPPLARAMVKNILADAKMHRPDKYLEKLFIQDNAGYTPIYIAALNKNAYYLKKLLKLLKENNALHYANIVNGKGLTATHLAASNLLASINEKIRENANNEGWSIDAWIQSNKTVCLGWIAPLVELINAGIGLSTQSDEKKTAFDVLSSYPVELQRLIFFKLDGGGRRYLKEYYDWAFSTHPEENNLTAFYERHLAGLTSLKQRVLAHLEFEDPIIKNYVEVIHTFSARGKNDERTYVTSKRDDSVLDQNGEFFYHFGKLLPNYLTKVQEALPTDSHERNIIIEKLPAIPLPVMSRPIDQDERSLALQHDRCTISDLIDDIQTYIAELNDRPRTTDKYRHYAQVLAVAISVAITLGIIASAVGFRFYDNKANEDHHYLGRAGICLTMLFVLPTILVALGLFYFGTSKFQCCGNLEIKVSHNENHWQAILKSFQDDILSKINELTKLEKAEKRKYLMLPERDMNHLREFNNRDILYTNHSVTQAINLFTNLGEALKSLRTVLNSTNRPFTLFAAKPAADVVIEIPEDDNENAPLLLSHSGMSN